MKMNSTKNAVLSLGIALGLGWVIPAVGDEDCSCDQTWADSTMKGTSVYVNPADHTLTVRGFWGKKEFHVASDCKVLMESKATASAADLRPGQKLTVRYENADGVRVAHEITVRSLKFTGEIFGMDPARNVFMVHTPTLDKKFRYPDDCEVVLLENRSGKISDLQTGDRVTVVYEVPNQRATARQIIRTSATFAGSLTAIDLEDKTLKAGAAFKSKSFTIGRNCKVVLTGNPDAQLSDLKLGDKLFFSYEDVKGVNVVNRISTMAETSTVSSSSSTENVEATMTLNTH